MTKVAIIGSGPCGLSMLRAFQQAEVKGEKMPEIKGGLKSLSKIIKYPKEAKKLGVQGVVYVQFIVDEKGVVVDPKLIRKLGAGCDEEALRALEKLKFNPGYVQGKPVKARFTLPIRFAL